MSQELISKATRNDFREVLTGFVLREIDMIFETANLSPKLDYTPPVGGQRRSLVEQYYANINFSSPRDAQKLASAYEEVIEQLEQRKLQVANPEEVQVTIDLLLRRMKRDGFEYKDGKFALPQRASKMVEAPSLINLSEESIHEHLEKARLKIASGDQAGAITNCYTLVESLLKELLHKTQTEFKQDEGDIRELYRLLAGAMNLNPKGENLESYLKQILEGLKSQISGLFALANKCSDRHSRKFNPMAHHAKLAVNATFSLCEFLLDSYDFQQKKTERKNAEWPKSKS